MPPDRFPPEGPDPELLGRYLAGECTESEAAFVRRCLMARPDAARTLDTFLARLDGPVPAMPDEDASWAALSNRLKVADGAATASSGSTPARSRTPHRHFVLHSRPDARPWWRRSWALAIAATAAAAVIVALRGPEARRAEPAAAPRVYATSSAQRAEITLTDGTRITLAPESRLRVSADFGTERRDVYLEGEAFFDVAHDAARPFTAYAGNASAHDIGTAFAIRSYANDHSVQIAVREGVVAMSGIGPLAAGDVGTLTSDGRTNVRHGADVGALLGWLDGKLAYTDAPLGRVVDDLHRWHGAEIVIRDSSLAALPFTGEMNGLSTASALDLVARTLGLRVRRDGERFTLSADARRAPRLPNRQSR